MKYLSRLACGILAALLAMLPLCALAEAPGPIPGMIDEKVEITVEGNFITVFDNGNRNGTSRVVGYCIDTQEKVLKAFRSYTLGGKYSEACGSAHHLYDEIYIIGWGATMGDPEAMSVIDFATGEMLMSVSLKNPMNSTYRCLYFE